VEPSQVCLDEDELQALVSGVLDEARLRGAEAHLRSCDSCSAVVAAALADLRPTTPASGLTADDADEDSTRPLAPGERFARFVITGVVGRGGWGTVYRAEDTELQRSVAIKVLTPSSGSADATLALGARLRAEARAMAKLAHPNVVTLHDVGTLENRAFVVMELVLGSNLRQWLPPSDPGVRCCPSSSRRGAGCLPLMPSASYIGTSSLRTC
jgi:hypothetical protein